MYFFCCTGGEDDAARELAATKIQAVQRGKMARQRADMYRQNAVAGTADLADGSGEGSSKLLKVIVVSAKNLRNVVKGMTYRAKSSPFVKVSVGDVHFHTKIVKRNLSPKFEQAFELVDYKEGTDIEFEVFHPAVKKAPEISLGTCSLSASEFTQSCDKVLSINDPGNTKKGVATLSVKVDWVQPSYSSKRISAFMDQPAEQWIVRYKAIGLRSGPGIHEKRVNIDLKPGEQFDVVETVEGAEGQSYLRLKDGRGWAFTKSPRTGEILAEKLEIPEEVNIDEEGDAAADNDAEIADGEAPEQPEDEENL